ncbi:MAG: hypothetical protein KF893_00550 [Caldilineaceae bacterium]|nr:hypothetical protein [Caldilineaceae bacterium]
MTSTTRRIQKHKQGRKTLSGLFTSAAHVQVIHYSCESFYDRTGGNSPRITSIAVRNLATENTRSFSIHAKAEVHRLSGNALIEQYDKLEKLMLDDYFEFVSSQVNSIWLHWNMRDIVYGFQAIEHRYEVLGGTRVVIPDNNKVDLSSLLVDIYGPYYIGQPRLASLIGKNRINDKDFLAGAEEAVAFERHEYFKMHLSTLRKVQVIAQIAELAYEGRLKTDMSLTDIYGLNPEAVGEFLKDHWLISIITFVVAIASLVVSLLN